MKRVVAGIVIGSTSTAALILVAVCWRTLREADAAGLHALAEINPIVPRPEFVDDLWDRWAAELAKEGF